jgi:hypothetical protein
METETGRCMLHIFNEHSARTDKQGPCPCKQDEGRGILGGIVGLSAMRRWGKKIGRQLRGLIACTFIGRVMTLSKGMTSEGFAFGSGLS